MHRVWYLRLILLVAVCLLGGAGALAMMAPDTARAILFPQIEWQELTAEQQKILKPLAGKWAAMKYAERERWRALTERYPQLSAAEQKRIQKRMRRWAATTSEQRHAARANYRKFKDKASAEKKQEAIAAWQSYAATQGLLDYAGADTAPAAVPPAPAAAGGDAAREPQPMAAASPEECQQVDAAPPCAGGLQAGANPQAQANAGNP